MRKKLILLVLVMAITLSLCLSSCSARLEYKEGLYYCDKNGVVYKSVDLHFSPVTIGEKYAVLDDIMKMDLFELHGVSPEKWLTSENGDLFCSADEKVPTLNEMDVDTVFICLVGDKAVMALSQVNKKEHVDYVMDAYLNGMTLQYPDTFEISETLLLRLASKKYNWLYYNLSYVEFAQDVLVSDYPENLSSYTYRDVDDSVKISVLDEFECWYSANSKIDVDYYEGLAKDAGIQYYTVTKPSADGVSTYVVHVYQGKNTHEECFEYFREQYEGDLSDDKINEAIWKTEKTNKLTRVEYNYGKYFIYDRFTGRCVKVDDTLYKYKENKIED